MGCLRGQHTAVTGAAQCIQADPAGLYLYANFQDAFFNSGSLGKRRADKQNILGELQSGFSLWLLTLDYCGLKDQVCLK